MRRIVLPLLAALLPVACASDPAPAPPIPTAGVLTLPSLLHRPDLVDVDVGPTGGTDWWSTGELVVIGLDRPADQRYVVQATPPPSVDLPGVEIPNQVAGIDVGGHPAVLDTYGSTPGCGRNVLTVTVAPDATRACNLALGSFRYRPTVDPNMAASCTIGPSRPIDARAATPV